MSRHSKPRGVLIPIGGGEDRGEEKEPRLPFEQKGVLKHILDKAKGPNSKVVLVTSASSIPKEVSEAYRFGFGRLGCHKMLHYHMTKRSECNEEALLKDFSEADVVMFSGGNQVNLPKWIRKTKLHDLLKDRYWNDTLVIAGTSAGAMAMSEFMVAGGSASEAFVKGAVQMSTGLGLIPELIIDTHFVRRGRFGRLAEAVAIYPQCIGIGLAEDTGVIIEGGDHFTVIGSGMAIVMDPRNVTHNNHALLKKGTLMSMTNLTTHLLANGDKFRLADHSTEVLPMGQSFI
jgi:cyanophycinase